MKPLQLLRLSALAAAESVVEAELVLQSAYSVPALQALLAPPVFLALVDIILSLIA